MAASHDMVREILLRVNDVTTLFRCATVCRGWRRLLVADETFLRRCLPEDASFPGIFYQPRTCKGCPPPRFFSAPRSVLAPRPVLGDGRRSLCSLFPCVSAGYFDRTAPLASRQGLLLVRLEPPRAADDADPGPRGDVPMAVCDPFAGTVRELPRLDHDWDLQEGTNVSGYALLTAADCPTSNDDHGDHRRPGFFKVLIVTINHWEMRYILHVFSSADQSGRWNTRSGALDVSGMLMQHNAVVLGGTARWLLCGEAGTYTVDVSAETGNVSTTKMTGVRTYGFCGNAYDKPYLTVDGEGNLTVLRLKTDGRELEILTSHDDGRSFQVSRLELTQPDRRTTGTTNHGYTCLGEKYGVMFIKVKHRHIHITDIKTGIMWEVLEWPSCTHGLNRNKIVPLEIDWLTFFASRLAIAT